MNSKLRTLLLSLTLALFLSPLAGLQAQEADNVAPVIEVEELASAKAADTQVFTAQIAEDRELLDSTLYHRRRGQIPYQAIAMDQIGDTSYYSAVVNTDPSDVRAIEYYVQARDKSGNRTVYGYAFEPIVREITPSAVPAVASTGSDTTATNAGAVTVSRNNRKRYIQIALGVLAVGTLAAIANSGGSGDTGESVPLTINLDEF